MVSPLCFQTLSSFSIYMSARKPFFLHKLKVPSLPFSICFYLKTKPCPVLPSMMSRKSPITPPQCNTVFVASRVVFLFHCGSFARFTEFCYEADVARTRHRVNFVAHRIELAVAVREMLRSFPLRRNA